MSTDAGRWEERESLAELCDIDAAEYERDFPSVAVRLRRIAEILRGVGPDTCFEHMPGDPSVKCLEELGHHGCHWDRGSGLRWANHEIPCGLSVCPPGRARGGAA